MAERIPQSTSYLVVFRAFLASDGKTPATSKTIAITISKNGATSFSNPNAGATNATEMASGFYKFTLDTTDTGTLGPIAWRGAHADINDAGDVLSVVKATNAGFTALPDAAAEASGGLFTRGTGAGQINQAANGMADMNVVRNAGTAITAASGRQEVNVSHFGGSAGTFSGGRPETNTTHWAGTVVASANVLIDGAITAAKIATDAITAAKIATDAITSAKVADGFLTAAKFASGAFDAVWSVATRLLTAGTNIVLAKGTGVTGFTDLDAAGVRAAVGLASANLDTQLGDLPTNGELATALGTSDDAVLAALVTLAGYVDTEVAQIVTLLTAARGEPGQGAPAVNPSSLEKIDYLYKAWRNKKDNNATETKLYADNGTTVDHKQTTSESGGTVTKGEWITGA